jgi:hypothetical protein
VPVTIAYKCAAAFSEEGILVEDTDRELLLKAAWTQFFKEAAVRDEVVSNYAKAFYEQKNIL